MRDREGWLRGPDGPVRAGRRQKLYSNLVQFTRACAHCQQPFSIFVTKKIADGLADSNSFGLRNCEKHRRNAVADPLGEETIMANNVMREELEGCYRTIADLKARLAMYELPAAMARQAEGVTRPMALQDAAASSYGASAPLTKSFPWS